MATALMMVLVIPPDVIQAGAFGLKTWQPGFIEKLVMYLPTLALIPAFWRRLMDMAHPHHLPTSVAILFAPVLLVLVLPPAALEPFARLISGWGILASVVTVYMMLAPSVRPGVRA
jgi:hypothetical protein